MRAAKHIQKRASDALRTQAPVADPSFDLGADRPRAAGKHARGCGDQLMPPAGAALGYVAPGRRSLRRGPAAGIGSP